MMRNGRGLMPTYNRIEERDRWDVVNYLRALQGRVTGIAFETGPVAPPGVTGAALPSATQLAPQTWIRPMLPNVKAVPRDSAPAPDTTRHGGAGDR